MVEIGEEYYDHELWDRGYMNYDESGREIPLPEDAHVVVRLLRGKILIVAKTSLWNSESATYDGRHDTMTTARIRDIIERSLEPSQ